MHNPFAITSTSPETTALDRQRQGYTTFTITNATGAPLTARAVAVPTPPTDPQWLTVERGERAYATLETHQVDVHVQVPMRARPGRYGFRLAVAEHQNPDDVTSASETVWFEVPEPAEAPRRRPWWPLALGGALALVAVGAIVGVVTHLPSEAVADQLEPPAEPVAALTPEDAQQITQTLLRAASQGDLPAVLASVEEPFLAGGELRTGAAHAELWRRGMLGDGSLLGTRFRVDASLTLAEALGGDPAQAKAYREVQRTLDLSETDRLVVVSIAKAGRDTFSSRPEVVYVTDTEDGPRVHGMGSLPDPSDGFQGLRGVEAAERLAMVWLGRLKRSDNLEPLLELMDEPFLAPEQLLGVEAIATKAALRPRLDDWIRHRGRGPSLEKPRVDRADTLEEARTTWLVPGEGPREQTILVNQHLAWQAELGLAPTDVLVVALTGDADVDEPSFAWFLYARATEDGLRLAGMSGVES